MPAKERRFVSSDRKQNNHGLEGEEILCHVWSTDHDVVLLLSATSCPEI
jgi:hypothetical protein